MTWATASLKNQGVFNFIAEVLTPQSIINERKTLADLEAVTKAGKDAYDACIQNAFRKRFPHFPCIGLGEERGLCTVEISQFEKYHRTLSEIKINLRPEVKIGDGLRPTLLGQSMGWEVEDFYKKMGFDNYEFVNNVLDLTNYRTIIASGPKTYGFINTGGGVYTGYTICITTRSLLGNLEISHQIDRDKREAEKAKAKELGVFDLYLSREN